MLVTKKDYLEMETQPRRHERLLLGFLSSDYEFKLSSKMAPMSSSPSKTLTFDLKFTVPFPYQLKPSISSRVLLRQSDPIYRPLKTDYLGNIFGGSGKFFGNLATSEAFELGSCTDVRHRGAEDATNL